MELKLLFTEREKLLKTLRIIGSTSEGIGYIPKEAMDDVLKINKVVVKQLQKAIEKVEQKMKEIIQSNEQLKLQNELIQSIPGVGPQTALYIILVTNRFSPSKTGDKWLVMQEWLHLNTVRAVLLKEGQRSIIWQIKN
ncbi:hypothetical protein [Flavobacterium marginilacus]|uniref:hypothetical protein n=1 Tax=Flavobacterium marginilacus TaxID=3003256 RepID=UPI00248D6676|nr:hypothetical protein [Flavobacterium marginilacus]